MAVTLAEAVSMDEARFLVDGPGITRVASVAERLHPSFVGLLECPQQLLPDLAGRRMFFVGYSQVDSRDVERIRQELGQALNTQAWTTKVDANGRFTFYPERTGPNAFPRPPMQTNEDDPPPDYEDFSDDSYGDDYDDGDSDEDWEWDYFAHPPHYGYGRHFANTYHGGGGYGDYPDPHSHRSHGRTTFATDYDHRNRHENYFAPPPFGNSRRNTFPRGYEDPFMYGDELGPPSSRHNRRSDTFPRNYGPEYPDHRSRGHPSGDPYANHHDHVRPANAHHHGNHHGHTHGSSRERRPSHPDPYDRPRVYPGPPPHGAHFPRESGHGRHRHRHVVDGGAPRARSNRREGCRKKISRKLRNMIGAFMMYAMT